MSDKKLSFSIDITGVSNEAAEISKLEISLRNLKKEREELMKQATRPGHIGSNEEKLKLAAYNKEINEQSTALKSLKRVVDTANDSLDRKRDLLIKLKRESAAASDSIAKSMAPSIKKLNDEISAGEQARGVFTRNVENYPGMFSQVANAAGGAAGKVGDFVATAASSGGPLGIFTAGVSALALAWKTAQENIKLYLESADKLNYGAAAFTPDAAEALKDAAKRAKGGISEGSRLEAEAKNRLLLMKNLTDEQKAQLQLQIKAGQEMQKDNQALLDSLGKNKDKGASLQKQLEWKQKYSELLKKEEELDDQRQINATRWEEMEGNLVKQRAIVSDMQSTEAQKKQAAIDADIIANQLAGEKIRFVNEQIDNVTALAEMTGSQEVVESRINDLLKERNTIQKEFYADQVKINRLERQSSKGGTGTGLHGMSFDEFISSVDSSVAGFAAPSSGGNIPAEVNAEYEKQKLIDAAWEEGMQKARENYQKQKNLAVQAGQELIDQKITELNAEQEIADAKLAISAGVADVLFQLAGKNRELSYGALIAEKATAIGQVWSNIGIANAKAIAVSPLTGGQPWVAINSVIGGLQIAKIIAESGKAAAEINSAYKQSQVPKYEDGGRITHGVHVNTGAKDNILILANNQEAIINERQIAMLGGSGAMRRAGIPGFEDGGYIGQQAPYIPPSSSSQLISAVEKKMEPIEVFINTHKIISSIKEIEAVTKTQPI